MECREQPRCFMETNLDMAAAQQAYKADSLH